MDSGEVYEILPLGAWNTVYHTRSPSMSVGRAVIFKDKIIHIGTFMNIFSFFLDFKDIYT